MTAAGAVAAVFGSYLLGSVSFAYLFVRWKHGIDLRTVGSGNLGATNAGRVLGRKYAAIVYALDFLKGFIPVVVARALAPDSVVPLGAGLAAFLGHCFPVWLRFRGGKGVATASGVIVALAPIAGVVVLAVFAATVKLFGYISLGSIVAAIALPIAHVVVSRDAAFHPPEVWTLGLFVILGGFVVVRHRRNIGRLMRGEEPKVGGNRQ